jgi:hypothetical protein
MLAATLIAAFLAAEAGAQVPDPSAVLSELGFPADAEKKVLAGNFVTADVKPTSEREIAIGMAFFLKVPPKELVSSLQKGLSMHVDPNAHAHGFIKGDGSLAEFERLDMSSRSGAYLKAKPGSDLNLSSAEIAAFKKLAGQSAGAAEVEKQVHESLLARLRAYRKSGLDGIAPYARAGGEQRSGAEDLRAASAASAALKKHAPAFYGVLNGYPASRPPELEERFLWVSYDAHGTPVAVLTHAMSLADGDAYAMCMRQFYVSGRYNVEQAVAGFLPVTGGTLVVYVNRTSTDQITGFAGSGKRAIGRRVMASQLKDLFEKFRAKAAK